MMVCTTKNFMQACPCIINIFINKNLKINSISMTFTSGSPSGAGTVSEKTQASIKRQFMYKLNPSRALLNIRLPDYKTPNFEVHDLDLKVTVWGGVVLCKTLDLHVQWIYQKKLFIRE